ncbi:DNA primase [Parabacteroides sp. PF5-5]|uniref:DNA primase n=1 Tax=unclassified Parabacteroides TaxID=2649774 RepID=UPI002475173C|nr:MULTISPECIES: DNA primase [unclassified Parabacteroides]MDH6305677.1 DNA primase [Parabacteroides sp. PH5-39]MDH6316749.1 DNA primase [Parabacteroides sp. PF5-13]MDH6320390.1 DNA primase [Parabacteroides sp. PH5-13]MDH6324120.1 DNA primase [Parabacteroides sp. PH5-8]MDH6327935.1 DNA primase [Parabacteroides sp. PH5-41]
MIDQFTIDRILEAAKIEDVVSEFVTLRKRGVNLVGLCPFHADKTPSFYVSKAKNICKCFACGEGGTPVHFIMKHEQVSYFDALRYLAKKYGIEIQERELTDEEKQVRSDRESMLIVNSWAQKYFSTQLFEHVEGSSIGLRYFKERGFRDDIVKKFQLGYSLDERDAISKAAAQAGYKQEFLEKTGLIIAYENGGVSDRFRGRVMFPVHSVSGKVVAFGGRILKKDEKTAKYVNSPESEIYHKSNELYGIFFAKQSIVKRGKCFLVEGYTDVISMHQAGIENVVASSGTALTFPQIRLIHRFTDNITVLYDGDAAGIKAALRGIDLLLEEGMNVKVVLLPEGEDPDSYARKHNSTEFHEFIEKSETDFIRFKTKLLLDEAAGDPMKRSALITDIIKTVAIVPDEIARTFYIRECSTMMEIDERLLLNEINKIRLKQAERQPTPVLPPQGENLVDPLSTPQQEGTALLSGKDMQQRSPFEAKEKVLLRYVVRFGEKVLFDYEDTETHERKIIRVAEYIYSELEQDNMPFQHALYKEMLQDAVTRCKEEGFVASRYFLSHPDPDISRLAVNLVSDKYQLSKYHTKFQEIKQEEDSLVQTVLYDILGFKDAYIRQQINEIGIKIKELQSTATTEEVIALMKEQDELNKIKKALNKQIGERIVLKM